MLAKGMDLTRELLSLIEENALDALSHLPDHIEKKRAIAYLLLAEQAGFTRNTVKHVGDEVFLVSSTLTPAGQVFLESIKDEKAWNYTKRFFEEKGIHMDFR